MSHQCVCVCVCVRVQVSATTVIITVVDEATYYQMHRLTDHMIAEDALSVFLNHASHRFVSEGSRGRWGRRLVHYARVDRIWR